MNPINFNHPNINIELLPKDIVKNILWNLRGKDYIPAAQVSLTWKDCVYEIRVARNFNLIEIYKNNPNILENPSYDSLKECADFYNLEYPDNVMLLYSYLCRDFLKYVCTNQIEFLIHSVDHIFFKKLILLQFNRMDVFVYEIYEKLVNNKQIDKAIDILSTEPYLSVTKREHIYRNTAVNMLQNGKIDDLEFFLFKIKDKDNQLHRLTAIDFAERLLSVLRFREAYKIIGQIQDKADKENYPWQMQIQGKAVRENFIREIEMKISEAILDRKLSKVLWAVEDICSISDFPQSDFISQINKMSIATKNNIFIIERLIDNNRFDEAFGILENLILNGAYVGVILILSSLSLNKINYSNHYYNLRDYFFKRLVMHFVDNDPEFDKKMDKMVEIVESFPHSLRRDFLNCIISFMDKQENNSQLKSKSWAGESVRKTCHFPLNDKGSETNIMGQIGSEMSQTIENEEHENNSSPPPPLAPPQLRKKRMCTLF